jgi:6-pyruvoyltetrahydropterin/6-carboxytetrahydropterin synthase
MQMLTFRSSKKYTAAEGLSCTYRNWRAVDSHCSKLHGYSLSFEFWFERRDKQVSERYWVQDFGALKPLKAWLKDNFDHTLLLDKDDPQFNAIWDLREVGIADVRVVEAISCEAFAAMGLRRASELVGVDVRVLACEVAEHEGNSAICMEEEEDEQDVHRRREAKRQSDERSARGWAEYGGSSITGKEIAGDEQEGPAG